MSRLSLYDELKKGGYEAALITTYNIDFPFYEDVVLRRMRSSGIDHHIVMVDSRMCSQAISTRPPAMSGYHYSLAPMRCGAAFHPKLLLLLGKEKGMLAVGSHNLTLSGYGNNLEVTNIVRYHKKKHPETLHLFKKAYLACKTWMNDYGNDLPPGITDSLKKMADIATWINEETKNIDQDSDLLFTSSSTHSLWGQAAPLVKERGEIKSILGMSAFFDHSLGFIHTLSELSPERFHLAIQPATVGASSELLNLPSVDVMDTESLFKESAHHYIHAKLLHLQGGDNDIFISGSANLSSPAWLASGEHKNAEAILMQKGEAASHSYQALELSPPEQGQSVTEIPSNQTTSDILNSGDGAHVHIVNYEGNNEVRIRWEQSTHNLVIGYQNNLQQIEPLKFSIHNNYLHIESHLIRHGEALQIHQYGAAVAHIIIHHERQIDEYSSTGLERKLRHALGSLNTSSPELDILFGCVERLMLNKDRSQTSVISSHHDRDKAASEEPETLISNLEDRKQNHSSGKFSLLSTGDISLIMSTLISSLDMESSKTSAGLDEDQFGRNEEEQIGQDDEDDSQSLMYASFDESNKVAEIIHRRLSGALKRLDEYLKANSAKEDSTGARITATLGVVIFVHHLRVTNAEFAPTNILIRLLEIISSRILTDKDPIETDTLDEDNIYRSDDWGRLLGYLAWIAFRSGITLHKRPPLSVSREEREQLIWKNAVWLYLSQRIIVDNQIQRVGANLATKSETENFQRWYSLLLNYGATLQDGEFSKFTGYMIAKSPNEKIFPGYRLVINTGEDMIHLATVTEIGGYNSFKQQYAKLEVRH